MSGIIIRNGVKYAGGSSSSSSDVKVVDVVEKGNKNAASSNAVAKTLENSTESLLNKISETGQHITEYPVAEWMTDGEHNGFIAATGEVTADSNWVFSDYIPVKKGDFICGSQNNIGNNLHVFAMYDENKTFIDTYFPYANTFKNNLGWWATITDESVAYIRVNCGVKWWQQTENNLLVVISNRDPNIRIKLTLDRTQSKSFNNCTNLLEAFNKAWALGNCDLTIKNGTYDVISETTFTYNDFQRSAIMLGAGDYNVGKGWGLRVGRNNHYYMDKDSKITLFNTQAAGSPYYETDYVVSLVSALHICGSATINNFNVEVENCRYCVHEDCPAYMYPEELESEAKGYVLEYNNCNMNHNVNLWSGATYNSSCTIGAGTWKGSTTYINGGYYKIQNASIHPVISYHNCSADTTERVYLNNVQATPASGFFQFYGFVAEGSHINAYNNGSWAPLPIKIIGTEDRIDLQETDFARKVWNQYENFAGGSFGGYPVYHVCKESTIKALNLNDSGTWKSCYTLQKVKDVLSVKSYLVIKESETNTIVTDWIGTDIYIHARALIDPTTDTSIIQLSLTDPYSYSTLDNIYVRTFVEYTKLAS